MERHWLRWHCMKGSSETARSETGWRDVNYMSLLSESDWKPYCKTCKISVADNMGRVPDVKIGQSAVHMKSGGRWPDNSQHAQQYHITDHTAYMARTRLADMMSYNACHHQDLSCSLKGI